MGERIVEMEGMVKAYEELKDKCAKLKGELAMDKRGLTPPSGKISNETYC